MSSPPTNVYDDFNLMNDVLPDEALYETRIENDANGQPLYVGLCVTPNGDPALPIWNLKKLYYDGNGFTNRVQLPDDGPFFTYTWDDRSSYFT